MKHFATIKNSNPLLGSLASIRAGYNFRGRIESDPSGEIGVLQTKDITNEGSLVLSNLLQVTLNDLSSEHFLQQGDVLLRSRGGETFPAACVPELTSKIIAAFPILVVRVDKTAVVPEYLTWLLNQGSTQGALQALAQSTFIPTISKAGLQAVSIPIPPVALQQQIVTLKLMIQLESDILQTLAAKRKAFAQRLLLEYAEGRLSPPELEKSFNPLVHDIALNKRIPIE
jgi:restriction endonuclease S subunit